MQFHLVQEFVGTEDHFRATFSEVEQSVHSALHTLLRGIVVTTGIITKVSASSVHWGLCEGSTTDLG